MSHEKFSVMQNKSLSSRLQESDICHYLENHPDFFSHQAWLLEKMHVPHQVGNTVSLVERQASLLRERNQKLNGHLSELIDIARYNDIQFEKTKRMVLALLECATLDDVAIAIEESLCQDFHGDDVRLIVFSNSHFDVNNLRLLTQSACTLVQPLMESSLPSCGQLSASMNRFLFQEKSNQIRSAAVVPLIKGETIGLLAIGSFDPDYFQSSQGTTFLSYVGEVLSRVIVHILHSRQP